MYVIKGATVSNNHHYFSSSSTSASAEKPSIRVAESSACSCSRPRIVYGSVETFE